MKIHIRSPTRQMAANGRKQDSEEIRQQKYGEGRCRNHVEQAAGGMQSALLLSPVWIAK